MQASALAPGCVSLTPTGCCLQYVLKDYRAGRSRVPTPPPSVPKPDPDAAPENMASGGQEEGQGEVPGGGEEDPEGDGYKRLWSPEEDAQLALLVSSPHAQPPPVQGQEEESFAMTS